MKSGVLNACTTLTLMRMQLSLWTWPLSLTFHLVENSVYHTERSRSSGLRLQLLGFCSRFRCATFLSSCSFEENDDLTRETCKWNAEVMCHLQSQHLLVFLCRRHGRCWKQVRKTNQAKFPKNLRENSRGGWASESVWSEIYNTDFSFSCHTALSYYTKKTYY